MEISEKLIESPNSESPEIREQRERVKNALNEIMDLQEEMKPLVNKAQESEFVIDSASKEEKERADRIIAELNIELASANADTKLN